MSSPRCCATRISGPAQCCESGRCAANATGLDEDALAGFALLPLTLCADTDLSPTLPNVGAIARGIGGGTFGGNVNSVPAADRYAETAPSAIAWLRGGKILLAITVNYAPIAYHCRPGLNELNMGLALHPSSGPRPFAAASPADAFGPKI